MSHTAASRAWTGGTPTQPFSKRGRIAILFGVSVLLIVVTRLPFVPSYLYSFDDVNFALALKQFDPARNQPQPPGYPFFVAEARLLYPLFATPERTFAFLASLISGLAVGMMYLLGRRLFSPGVGFTAAILLFVNPVFWFSGLTSPLRPHLALFSILVAYFCWRAMSGEPGYFYAASLALGLGSGFRPELLLLLFPLWAWTAWQCRSSLLRLVRGGVLLGASALLWVAVVVIASGGMAHIISSFSEYLFSQTQQTSLLWNPRSGTWLRSAGRAVLWNGLGVLPWIWTVPLGWILRHKLPERKRLSIFLALWFVPAFLFHLAVHIGDPDHVLTTVPVLCLIGGFCVAAAGEMIAERWFPDWKDARTLVIAIALGGNLLLFFGQFPVPQRGPVSGFRGWQSVEDAILIGTYETSYARVRWVDQMTELALDQVRDLQTAANRPVLLIWARDGEPVWRKISFYLPTQKIYSLDEKGDPAVLASLAQLWQGKTRLAAYSGPLPIHIPVPKGARLIWLVAPAGVEGLQRAVPLQKAAPLYYTDLSPDVPSFEWGSFEFTQQ